jgi:hypothetical protein
MRLYPKKLRNIEDLEQERARLLKEKKRLDKEDILSLDGILGKNDAGEGKEGAGFDISSLISMLPIANPIVGQVLKMVTNKFAGGGERSDESKERPNKKSGKNIFKSLAVEVIGGYLKWKAVELSYKGIRRIIKNRRKDKGEN